MFNFLRIFVQCVLRRIVITTVIFFLFFKMAFLAPYKRDKGNYVTVIVRKSSLQMDPNSKSTPFMSTKLFFGIIANRDLYSILNSQCSIFLTIVRSQEKAPKLFIIRSLSLFVCLIDRLIGRLKWRKEIGYPIFLSEVWYWHW